MRIIIDYLKNKKIKKVPEHYFIEEAISIIK